MSARPQLALVLILVLLAGLIGIFLWGGFGPGEGLSEGDPSAPRTARETAAGTLKGEAAVSTEPAGESQRESVKIPGQAAAAPKVEIFGRLVRSGGTPAPDVTLRFWQMDESQLLRTGRAVQPADVPTFRTDSEGRFRTTAKAESIGNLLLDGTETVFQLVTGRSMVVQTGKGSKDLGDVVILTAARVSGQVVDAAGAPVEAVSVAASLGTAGLFDLALGEGNKTDKEGRFELVGLRPGKQKLLTRSPEHLPAEQEVDLDEGQHREDILIRVQPGGFILGTVVDDLGQPIADAEVAASRTQQVDTQVKITAFSPGESTRTDAAGRFRLANLSTKKAQLRVQKDGLDTKMVADVVVGTTDLVVELKRLGSIEGSLVDEKNRPIQGSTVSASGSSGGFLAGGLLPGLRRSGTVTGADGRFRLENVQPGQVVVTAHGDAHLPARQRVDVRPGETSKGVRLVATPGTILEVTVQDASGQPVADAQVTVEEKKNPDGPIRLPREGARPGARPGARRVEYRAGVDVRRNRNGAPVFLGQGNTLGEGKTDARGVVTIGGLPAGEVVVSARHEELALVEPQELVLLGRGKATARLHMRHGGFLAVSAVDAAGKPVPNARFTVAPTSQERGQDEACDGQGKARVGPLAAGDYVATLLGEQRPQVRGGMSFTLAGSEPVLDDSKVRVQIREGNTTEIVLRRPVLTIVRGTVRDRSGPVKGAQVALTREGEIRMPLGGGLETSTDDEGRFEIRDVPSGKYTLSWGRRSAVVPSEAEVQFQKDQVELVRHLVIPGAVVKLRSWNQEENEAVEDAEVTLSRVSQGTQDRPQRQQTQFRMISITNRGSGSQRMDMSAGDRTARTDEDGLVVIKDVPAGRYELTVKHRRFATHREEIEILGDTTLDLGTRKLTSGGSISGQVLFGDTDGRQMALVQITTEDGKHSDRTVAMGGSFRFSGLATGKYKVRAQRIGNANAPWGPEQIVEVRPGHTTRTKLEL